MPWLMLFIMLPLWSLIGVGIMIARVRSRVPANRFLPVVAPVLGRCLLVGVPIGLVFVCAVAFIDRRLVVEGVAGYGLGLLLTGWALLVSALPLRRIGPAAQRLAAGAMALMALLIHAGVWIVAIIDGDMYSLMAAWLAPVFAVPVGMAIGMAAVAWKLPSLAPWPGADRCPICGYPRDGLASATTCPECGAAWEPVP